MANQLVECKIIKDRYLEDTGGSGLFFDLAPVKRIAGENDEGFRNRINILGAELKAKQTPGNVWYPAFFALPSQIAALPRSIRNEIAAKTYLVIFDSDTNAKYSPWDEYFADNIFCVNSATGKAYHRYNKDGSNLGYRFRRVEPDEVKAYKQPGQPTQPTNPTPDDNGQIVVGADTFIHLKCPHCGKAIF